MSHFQVEFTPAFSEQERHCISGGEVSAVLLLAAHVPLLLSVSVQLQANHDIVFRSTLSSFTRVPLLRYAISSLTGPIASGTKLTPGDQKVSGLKPG